MNSKRNLIFIMIFGILCILVVLHAGFNVNKEKTQLKEEILWDVVFAKDEEMNEIIVDYTNNVKYDMPQLFDSIVNDFDLIFNKSNEKIIYTFYIENKSEHDGYILQYKKPKVSCLNDNDLCISNLDKIKYSFVYDDGVEIKQNDIIKAKEIKKVHIIIEYLENKEDIPMNLTKLGLSLTFAKVK